MKKLFICVISFTIATGCQSLNRIEETASNQTDGEISITCLPYSAIAPSFHLMGSLKIVGTATGEASLRLYDERNKRIEEGELQLDGQITSHDKREYELEGHLNVEKKLKLKLRESETSTLEFENIVYQAYCRFE